MEQKVLAFSLKYLRLIWGILVVGSVGLLTGAFVTAAGAYSLAIVILLVLDKVWT